MSTREARKRAYLQSLRPCKFYRHITHIDFAKVVPEYKLKFLIIDLDNTLLAKGKKKNRSDVVPDDIVQAIDRAYEAGIEAIYILSNAPSGGAKEARVAKAAAQLRVKHGCVFYRRRKPRAFGFERAMKEMGAVPENTAMIGDQLFTDMLGAGRLHLTTFYVQPLGPDPLYSRYKRPMEKALFRLWNPTWEPVPSEPS